MTALASKSSSNAALHLFRFPILRFFTSNGKIRVEYIEYRVTGIRSLLASVGLFASSLRDTRDVTDDSGTRDVTSGSVKWRDMLTENNSCYEW